MKNIGIGLVVMCSSLGLYTFLSKIVTQERLAISLIASMLLAFAFLLGEVLTVIWELRK